MNRLSPVKNFWNLLAIFTFLMCQSISLALGESVASGPTMNASGRTGQDLKDDSVKMRDK